MRRNASSSFSSIATRMQQISPRQLADWIAECAAVPIGAVDTPSSIVEGGGRQKPVLLDVREPQEYEHCHIAGATLMPMHTVPLRLNDLDNDVPLVVICHHGGRSMQVAMFLERKGFGSIYNLAGGVHAWAGEVDPNMRQY